MYNVIYKPVSLTFNKVPAFLNNHDSYARLLKFYLPNPQNYSLPIKLQNFQIDHLNHSSLLFS